MLIDPLAKQSTVEFAVNEAGKALLFLKGSIRPDYSWIQYDNHSSTIQLITEDGSIQELGMIIPEKIIALLDKTRTVTLIEVADDYKCIRQTLTVFNKIVS